MASAWGKAWAKAWGNAWGRIAEPNQGGSGPQRKKRKKDTRFADVILRNREDRELKPIIITTEPFDNSALRLEFEQITKSIADKQNQLELRQISAYEYEAFVKDEAETLKVIMMALELDSNIILQIIT